MEIQKSQPYFLLGRFSFDLTFAVCLLGIALGANIVEFTACDKIKPDFPSLADEWPNHAQI